MTPYAESHHAPYAYEQIQQVQNIHQAMQAQAAASFQLLIRISKLKALSSAHESFGKRVIEFLNFDEKPALNVNYTNYMLDYIEKFPLTGMFTIFMDDEGSPIISFYQSIHGKNKVFRSLIFRSDVPEEKIYS